MALLKIGPVFFEAGLVVFDKDGTLLDFETMWGRLTRDHVSAILSALGEDGELAQELYRSVGYDWEHQRTLPRAPLATASVNQILTILANTLFRVRGLAWDQAESVVNTAWKQVEKKTPLREITRPTADLTALLSSLRQAGVRVALVTTDHRDYTEAMLPLLGIEGLLDFMACGDDDLPLKPAPEALLAACQELGVAPTRTVVVGDSVPDLVMGSRAGVGLKVGVLTGVSDRNLLTPFADVILDSVGEITVVTCNL